MTTLVCIVEEAELVGHHASIVLNQIRFWLYKAHNGESRYVVKRGGQRWLAHSREALCKETRLSSRQMRDALATLKKHGFIRAEQHLFHGKNVCHFQAAEEGRLVKMGQTKQALEVPPVMDETGHPELGPDDQLLKKENKLENEGEYGAPNAPTSFGKKIKKNEEEEDKEETCLPSGEINPSKLGAIYKAAWHEANPDSYLPEFNAKQMGQFKSLLQRCPLGEAAAIVDHSVRHWDVFCSYAISTEGAFNLPTIPHVGALLRFVQSAVNLYRDHRKSLAKPAPKKFIPPMPEKAAEPDEHNAATLEEVAAAFGHKL